MDDLLDDCGAMPPDDGCGDCGACQEAEADAIDRALESGAISEAEALERHALNGTLYADDED